MDVSLYLMSAAGVIGLAAALGVRDRRQRHHAVVSNFPIVGHFRYFAEELGGPLRQYIVTGNDEERPFSRDQRRWIYASSKKENNYFGFGTDNDLEQTPGYLIIRHSAFPVSAPSDGTPHYEKDYQCPGGKVPGGYRGGADPRRDGVVVGE